MDLVTQTSLEALLLKATNPQNENIDTAAVEAFCTLINKEKDGPHIGVKVVAARLPSGSEREVLQTLNILDMCMSRCGTYFQSEVGKFRFLNEMIKLVSPKYLGSHTPLSVKQKVLQLLYVWTLDYPKETKIKEAFDMLRKQGVIREIPNPNISAESAYAAKNPKQRSSIFQDEEKSKILQKLLQSKDPEDIQAANWLIKSMVKEDDKRAEQKSKQNSELESVQNNVRLLNEMLDSYKVDASSTDELDLIKELHESCERLRPNVIKLLADSQKSGNIFENVLQISDELNDVVNKYNRIVLNKCTNPTDSQSLLDFGQNSDASPTNTSTNNNLEAADRSTIDVLCDIFTTKNINIPDDDVLQPEVTAVKALDTENDKSKDRDKFKGLEELDALGEHLMKENLQLTRGTAFQKTADKVPMNSLTRRDIPKQISDDNMKNLDLNYLINKDKEVNQCESQTDDVKTSRDDDFLVDISDEKLLDEENDAKNVSTVCKNDIKLNDVFIKLENIQASTKKPITMLDDKNGISVTLHFAKDKPKEDVSVFVITTISKNSMPLTNYLFQAVVPKGCKMKLQPPSSTELPPFNPFLPPAAITQILLIANPEHVQVSLKFIISYCMDDETVTEMGEVDDLAMIN